MQSMCVLKKLVIVYIKTYTPYSYPSSMDWNRWLAEMFFFDRFYFANSCPILNNDEAEKNER